MLVPIKNRLISLALKEDYVKALEIWIGLQDFASPTQIIRVGIEAKVETLTIFYLIPMRYLIAHSVETRRSCLPNVQEKATPPTCISQSFVFGFRLYLYLLLISPQGLFCVSCRPRGDKYVEHTYFLK